ncbi:hypothetical protein EN817_13750 [Mesorhizobium sp. M3A.F.Ca.ET.174.01.1.1]|uniref:hypothetical protein n=1 Tax=unclassified Mesorhizobium TaxID=325217 RepID=UPI001093911A|nr:MULTISPECIES: hypothetical protein [unclassified Mesorhizobium]TGS84460.1 hypothetical protein EN818_24215 [Mesorhizobium sp. M3A.F.Ca.ET.175.01.1.1]TGT25687.1 hypothetical protein EN817_13750 [Mesorhizobium sp. M3A.F.Ca.ET.174.01.1.1]
MAILNYIEAKADNVEMRATASDFYQALPPPSLCEQSDAAVSVTVEKGKGTSPLAQAKTNNVRRTQSSTNSVTVQSLIDATGWQPPGRTFLSGIVKKTAATSCSAKLERAANGAAASPK